MARDRQRAKQRRRRQAQGPARAGGARAAASDRDAAALEPDVAAPDRAGDAPAGDRAAAGEAPDRGGLDADGPASPDRESVARETGLGDADIEEAGLGEAPEDRPGSSVFPSLGAPASIDHASAFADEARLAEAGAPLPTEDEAAGEIYEDELESAPDEIEGDLVPEGRLDPAVAEESRAAAPARAGHRPRSRARVIVFLGHVWDELRRVQWPDRRQVGQATAVVLGFIVVAGGYLGLLDAIWKPLVDAIL